MSIRQLLIFLLLVGSLLSGYIAILYGPSYVPLTVEEKITLWNNGEGITYPFENSTIPQGLYTIKVTILPWKMK